jgi:hypothetical protein
MSRPPHREVNTATTSGFHITNLSGVLLLLSPDLRLPVPALSSGSHQTRSDGLPGNAGGEWADDMSGLKLKQTGVFHRAI